MSSTGTGIEIQNIPQKTLKPSSNSSLGHIASLCSLPNNRLAAGTHERVYILDETAQIIFTFRLQGGIVVSLVYLESTNMIWAGENYRSIYILDVDTHDKHKLEDNIHTESIFKLYEGRGGTAGCVISAGSNGLIGLWAPDEHLIYKFNIGQNKITSLSVSAPHNLIILGDKFGGVFVWKFSKEKQMLVYKFMSCDEKCIFQIHNIYERGDMIIVGSQNGCIQLIDLVQGVLVKKLDIGNITGMTDYYSL